MSCLKTYASRLILLSLSLLFCVEGFAAKRNFKGLFGSYRRPKYVENEGAESALGMNFTLSTLIPVTTIVTSSETRGAEGDALNFTLFLNIEAEIFLNMWYHWQFFGRVGFYSYETTKESSTVSTATRPVFHQFEMDVFPIMGGVRYRFGREDIVPYLGVAVGIGYARRQSKYDNSPALGRTDFSTFLMGEVAAGLEFFFAPTAGLRVEMATTYMQSPEGTYDSGGSPTNNPIFTYKSNPFALRYAGGLFFHF